MRYRKRIKIMKGISVNISKSGASLSVGPKGASVTVGKRGAYSNVGIPGTGLYSRQKIASGQQQVSSSKAQTPSFEVRFNIDDDGKIIIKDNDGNEILDEGLLKIIKRTEVYKQAAQQLYERKHDEVEEESAKFINIYQFAPELKNEDFWRKKLVELKHQEYFEEEYQAKKPDISAVKDELTEIAYKKIRSILFWTNKEKRINYVEENLNAFFQNKMKDWEDNLIKHKDNELKRKAEIEDFNNEIDREYDKIENHILKGDEEYINSTVEERVNDIELPVEFSIDYDYDPKGHLFIDLDLPEMEDLPTTKAQIMNSGKVSIKSKTQKEMNKDYATCVCGLAFYFAGEFFNISPKINDITISGYTQRLSKKTGNIEDQYVFSVVITRDIFQKLDITKIDPIEAFNNFESILNATATFELKTIVPFGAVKGSNS